jgi:hypothetical protein
MSTRNVRKKRRAKLHKELEALDRETAALELEAARWHSETIKVDKAIVKEAFRLEKHRNPTVYIR